MKEYYIIIQNEQVGPLKMEEMDQVELKPDTLVWTDGMSEWVKAKNVEDFKDFFTKSPPPIPNIKWKLFKKKFVKEIKFNLKASKWFLLIGIITFLFLAIRINVIFERYNECEKKFENATKQFEEYTPSENLTENESEIEKFKLKRYLDRLEYELERYQIQIEYLIDEKSRYSYYSRYKKRIEVPKENNWQKGYRIEYDYSGFILFEENYGFKSLTNYILSAIAMLGSFILFLLIRYTYITIVTINKRKKSNKIE